MAIRRPVRLALALWIVWAIVVWNVVFDRMVVLAGRRYVYAAASAASSARPYVLINSWMPSEVSRAVVTATASSVLLLVVGLVMIGLAARSKSQRSG